MRVMGIDPGLQAMGWGVIEVDGARLRHVANGVVRSRAEDDLATRLLQLFDALTLVVADQAPDHAAVEQTFVNKDGAGALKLGQARAVALLVPARAGVPLGEYMPNAVKKAVVGVGHAQKAQVGHMVRLHLPGVAVAGPDAADALAVAICHAHHLQSATHLSAAIAKAEERALDGRATQALATVGRALEGAAMIGRVAGRLLYRAQDHVLIDARGVGYLVHVSDRTMAGLPRLGEGVALFTDLQVREDGWTLFGFPTLVEKEWHRLMLTVQGVGAKVSLAVLGALGPDALGRAIALGDWATLARAKGVGPKTAQRLVNELRDKAPVVMAMAGLMGTTLATTHRVEEEPDVIEAAAPAAPRPAGAEVAQAEALSALGNLGYGPGEAVQAVARAADQNPGAATPTLIRAALRLLAPQG